MKENNWREVLEGMPSYEILNHTHREDMERFIESALASVREETEKSCYWSPCSGCENGHPSFWKTIIESKEWDSWEEEQKRRFRYKDNKLPCYDIDECREFGWFSPGHFSLFLDFIKKETEREVLEEVSVFMDGACDADIMGSSFIDWYGRKIAKFPNHFKKE